MQPIFFAHIPKTAGTSLNAAVTKSLPRNAIERDYGADAPETSDLVQKHLYPATNRDAYAFVEAAKRSGMEWFTGHLSTDGFAALFGAGNTVSLVRDPVDRIISEYRHRQRFYGMDTRFEDFYRAPEETNKQFRMIGQQVWQAFRLVGTQDRYLESLQLLSSFTGLNLVHLTENTTPKAGVTEVSEDVRADIRKWNERDCYFYESVSAYLDKQLSALKANQPFCHHDMGFEPDTHLIGWAFLTDETVPVELGLYIDGQCRETVTASEYRPELHAVSAPRLGHCGFRFVLAPFAGAQTVEVKEQSTGQQLFYWART